VLIDCCIQMLHFSCSSASRWLFLCLGLPFIPCAFLVWYDRGFVVMTARLALLWCLVGGVSWYGRQCVACWPLRVGGARGAPVALCTHPSSARCLSLTSSRCCVVAAADPSMYHPAPAAALMYHAAAWLTQHWDFVRHG
jgi:hypothetical protein